LTIGNDTAYGFGNVTDCNMTEADLITLARIYSAHSGLTLSTVGTYAAMDGKFFLSLISGSGCTMKRASRIVSWFDSHWPEDLEWPRAIPRPSRQSEDAA